jgi:DNA-directed RNA polymerase subunit L
MSVNDIRKAVTTDLFEVVRSHPFYLSLFWSLSHSVQHHGSTEYTATFILGNEGSSSPYFPINFEIFNAFPDHTIGNTLRHVIMRQPETDFCGYSVPHPYEPKMNLRVQSHDVPAIRVLEKSLQQMDTVCDVLGKEFEQALSDYRGQ